MTKAQRFLEIVHGLGGKGYELKKVYRRIQDREMFLMAYGRLYANKGALTPGVNPDDTVEGMSIDGIDNIITALKNGEYEWQPVRRTEIPKKSGGKRPLGLPGWRDKLLQEVIRMVLEAYYEPQFSKYSHGFRPKRGCHTALSHIRHNWKGTKWFIEMDIEGCFDKIDQEILLEIIGRNIKDNRLIKLLRGMLKAGYMKDWVYHETYSGTPQGGVISPLLSNIYLNELDKFVEQELLPTYNQGDLKGRSRRYIRLSNQMNKAKKEGNVDLYKAIELERRKIPSIETHDPNYSRLRYVRYADDALLGLDGTKEIALEVKEKLGKFLKTIKLDMSDEKTLITHGTSGRAKFLSYEISIVMANEQLSKGNRKRAMNGQIKLSVPRNVVTEWKKKSSQNGKPIHRKPLTRCSDFEIVKTYGLELQGLVNYYTLAHDVSKKLYPVKYVMMESLAKTIASKHQKKVTWVYQQYKRKSEDGVTAIMVEVPNSKKPDKPYVAKFGDRSIKTSHDAVIKDEITKIIWGRNELVKRLTANECELCGKTEDIRVHHVRKLADVKKKYKGRKAPPSWAKFMMERNRKTVVVCQRCHHEIHTGQYDNIKVK